MTRTVYVNGEYLPETEAKVSIFDRGFLMADGVYEVTSVLGGKLIDFDGHARRLQRSLTELDMAAPVTERASSDARNRARRAISSGSTRRLMAAGSSITLSNTSSSLMPRVRAWSPICDRTRAVFEYPGQMALTVMP